MEELLHFTKSQFHAITNNTQFVRIDNKLFSLIQILNIPFIELQFGIFKSFNSETYVILSKHMNQQTYTIDPEKYSEILEYEDFNDLIKHFVYTFLQDRYITEEVFRALLLNNMDDLRFCINTIVRN
jgi:hypothetical protein